MQQESENGSGKDSGCGAESVFEKAHFFFAFFLDKPQVKDHGDDGTGSHTDQKPVDSYELRQEPNAQEGCGGADEEVQTGLFFVSDGIEDAGGDHAETHGQDHKTAVLNNFPAVQAGKEKNSDIFAEDKQNGNEQACDQNCDFQGAFDIQTHFSVFVAVVIFGEFRNENECERADEGCGDGQYGHTHSHGCSDLAHSFTAREAGGDESCGQEERDDGIDQGIGGTHTGDWQSGRK